MQQNLVKVHSLTCNYTGITNVINSPIVVQNTSTGLEEHTLSIWDTGATGSSITKSLALKLNLIAISRTLVRGIHGPKEVDVYAVKITLNNENVSFVLPATECDELTDNQSAQFLIGMDVITRGDFCITNFDGKTMMSFRVPSIERMDFVTGGNHNHPILRDKQPGRNESCPCGSGKKFKHCCGISKS
jgi:hypothetical protein